MSAFLRFAVRAAIVVFPVAIIITFVWYLHTAEHMSAEQIAQMTVKRRTSYSAVPRSAPLPMVLLEFGLSAGVMIYVMVLGIYALMRRHQATNIIKIAGAADPAWDVLNLERELFEVAVGKVIKNANTYDIEVIRPLLTPKYAEELASYYAKMRAKNIQLCNWGLEMKDSELVVAQDKKDNSKDRLGLRVTMRHEQEWRSMRDNALIYAEPNPDSFQTSIWWFERDHANGWLLAGNTPESMGFYETHRSFIET